MSLRIVCISDTHQLDVPELPEGDLLIHSGDWCGPGPIPTLITDGEQHLRHFCSQLEKWIPRFQRTIVIAGNHDFIAERNGELTRKLIEQTGAVYLLDSACTWSGISFWGSPIQPWFHDWAFNRHPGSDICQHWDLIPQETDILITHGPPHGILDRIHSGDRPHVGCEDLLRTVQVVKPKVHVFGHIHESYGQQREGRTLFVNSSILNEHYRVQNKPIVVTLEGLD